MPKTRHFVCELRPETNDGDFWIDVQDDGDRYVTCTKILINIPERISDDDYENFTKAIAKAVARAACPYTHKMATRIKHMSIEGIDR